MLKKRYPEWIYIYHLIMFEIRLVISDLKARISLRQIRLLKKMKTESRMKLHIACGENYVKDWINIDIGTAADLSFNVRRKFPLRTGSVKYIYSEHFHDHLHRPEPLRSHLKECCRVLEKGGIMRVVVHDAKLLVGAYLNEDKEFFRKITLHLSNEETLTPIECMNLIFRFNGFHQFIYDFETLKDELINAGFGEVRRAKFKDSVDSVLNLDLDLPDREIQSLYVEATV